MAGDGSHGGMDGSGMGGMPMSPPSSPSTDSPMAMAPGSSEMHMGGMHMAFFWGKNAEILFSGWPGGRLGTYLLALFVVGALAFLVESLSYVASRVASHNRRGVAQPSSSSLASILAGLAQTAVHAVRVGLAYVVMLAVMSFNVGVLLAAIAGHALGFFLFGSGAFRWGATVEDKH